MQPSFFTKHLFLIIGISLPFLLMIFVMISKNINLTNVPDPEYALVYTNQNQPYNYPKQGIDITNGALRAWIDLTNHPTEPKIEPITTRIQIHTWHPAWPTPKTYELILTLEQLEKRELIYYTIPSDVQSPIAWSNTAPDGYEFRPYEYRSNGFMPMLFVGGSGDRIGPHLYKDGREIIIPMFDTNNYWNIKALGWIKK